MLKNYLITAWKVFLRRKFFTFINLFGICITLSVIIVATRIIDNNLYPTGPEKNNANFLVISHLLLTNDSRNNISSSRPGYRFIQDYVQTLKSPEIIATYTRSSTFPAFMQEEKVEFHLRRTDTNYWRVLAFEFIKGQAYSQQQFEQGQMVAVITEHTALRYFKSLDVIGKTISIQNQSFKIIGVVNNVPRTELEAFADIWVPYTTYPTSAYREQMMGNFKAILFHSDADHLPEIKSEFIHRLQNNFQPTSSGMTTAVSHADTKLEAFARDFFGDELSFESYIQELFILISLLTFLFMLLPSVNMVNLNISRIMERTSEIGVRKAFGASTTQLVGQFIVENILLTLAGGFLAFLLSILILDMIEYSGLVPFVEFEFSIRIFAISLLMVLIFSLVSGVYPALKMARMDPVKALKGGV